MPSHASSPLAASHVLQVLELLRRRGADADELLARVGLREEQLADTDARLAVGSIERIIAVARDLSGEPGLGVPLGEQMRVTSFGYVGFAALSAATIGQALELATEYAAMRPASHRLRLRVEGSAASLVLEELVDLASARDTVLIALAVALWRGGSSLVGYEVRASMDFTCPEPEYIRRFAPRLPPIRFGQPQNRIVFESWLLEAPIVTADPVAFALAREQCERQIGSAPANGRLVERVRLQLATPRGGFRSLVDVSGSMGISARSLKRKLADHGVSFSMLVEREQRETAVRLLRSSDLSIEQIAEKVGYSSVSNFARAFRRWVGDTPAVFRRERAGTRRGSRDEA